MSLRGTDGDADDRALAQRLAIGEPIALAEREPVTDRDGIGITVAVGEPGGVSERDRDRIAGFEKT